MKMTAFYAFIFLLGVGIAQAIFYFPIMPDPMATHFGSDGEANGWMARESFFVFEAILFAIMIFTFLIMPRAFEKYKVKSLINIPNKDYWLAPERFDNFYAYFRESFNWFGVVTLIFLVGVMQLTFVANLQPNPVLNNGKFLILFAGYLLYVTIWSITYYRKFSKVEQ